MAKQKKKMKVSVDECVLHAAEDLIHRFSPQDISEADAAEATDELAALLQKLMEEICSEKGWD
jgi:hypothetical protein